jgi:hypothetical protein
LVRLCYYILFLMFSQNSLLIPLLIYYYFIFYIIKMLSDEKLIEMLVHSISGGIGGGIATACSYPFTNLRIRRIAK